MKRELCAILFGAFLCFSQSALAQEQDPAKLFEVGETYYKVGEWEKALQNYKEAYILSNQPELLFNMAQCYRQLGQYDDALRTYRTFLRDVPDSPERAVVESLIAEVEQKKAALSTSLAVEPPLLPASSAALTPAVEKEPSGSKKLWLYGGIGGGVAIVGVAAGLILRANAARNSTFGTFTPFPL